MKKNKAKQGDKISIEYEGRFEDGVVFDSSKKAGKPLDFEIGAKQVIPGFEKGIIGMFEGDEKEIILEPEEAYGEIKQELQQEIPKSILPQDQEPKVGMAIILGDANGRQFQAKIIKVNKDTIVVDLNHPLAGKKLIFKVKLLKINS